MTSYVITGAARGIGFEFVNQLSVPHDNKVFAIVRDKNTAVKLEELKAKRPNIHILQADITDYKALKTAASEVSSITGGTLDMLINNAVFIEGSRGHLTLDAYPDEETLTSDILTAVHVNVVGVIHTINAFIQLIRAGRTKKVITLSTGAADTSFVRATGEPGMNPYAISKSALNMAVMKYAVEYENEGIVFIALSPGLVNTATKPPTEDELQKYSAMFKRFQKVKPDLKGPMTPEESVRMQLEVINRLTIHDTGVFISHHGNTDWL